MSSRLPHLIVDYNDGAVGDGRGWVGLGMKGRTADRRIMQRFYEDQLAQGGVEPSEGLKVLMRDMDGDMPDVVGVMYWDGDQGWRIQFDPDDLRV